MDNVTIAGIDEKLESERMVEVLFTYKNVLVGTFKIKLNNDKDVQKGSLPKEEFLNEFTSCTSVIEMLGCVN